MKRYFREFGKKINKMIGDYLHYGLTTIDVFLSIFMGGKTMLIEHASAASVIDILALGLVEDWTS